MCAKHQSSIVVLEDVTRSVALVFAADPAEIGRLVRELKRGPAACHPLFDFIRCLLNAFEASPGRVVLEDVRGQGIADWSVQPRHCCRFCAMVSDAVLPEVTLRPRQTIIA
jgi:hypothetical protein